ncbi:MAG: metallophosphoesterase, partial [Pirellulales bacterium]|nr:metallophosphoesterase [Pirellulales bacterium]
GSWTLVILPDTQNYSTFYPGLFELQTRWIVENKDKHNIVYVLQNGDVTNRNSALEWERASRAMGLLDSVVPYAMVPGNHDYTPDGGANGRSTRINDYFPPSRFERWPTFGGTMEPGRIENNYHLFEAGGKKWLVVGLEFGPRDKTLDWAGAILAQHADRKAIVVTHAYLFHDSTRYDWAAKGDAQRWNPHAYKSFGGVNDGEEMWRKLIKKYPNVVLVNNGHVLNDGLGFQVSQGEQGNRVNEMLVNFQMKPVGGGGWLRLLEFLPDGRTVQVKNYSPLYEQYQTGPEDQFVFTID